MNKNPVTPKDALVSLVCVQKSCEHLGIYPIIKEHLIKIGDFIGGEYVDDMDGNLIHSYTPKRSTIQQETIDALSRSALTSSIAHRVSEAIKNTDASFEIIRILTSALIAADKEAEIYKKQCINLSQKNPVIPPIILDGSKYHFIAEQK